MSCVEADDGRTGRSIEEPTCRLHEQSGGQETSPPQSPRRLKSGGPLERKRHRSQILGAAGKLDGTLRESLAACAGARWSQQEGAIEETTSCVFVKRRMESWVLERGNDRDCTNQSQPKKKTKLVCDAVGNTPDAQAMKILQKLARKRATHLKVAATVHAKALEVNGEKKARSRLSKRSSTPKKKAHSKVPFFL